MTLALIAACAVLQSPTAPGFYQTLFPNPTGRNGYEEIARAMDLMKNPSMRAYSSWQPPELRPKAPPIADDEDVPKPDPKTVALRERLNGMSRLAVLAEQARIGAPVTELIRKALEKPISRPSRLEGLDFPELAEFRSIARLLADSAYVSFAQGRPNVGADLLETGMRFTDAVAGLGLLGMLTSIGGQARLMAAYQEHSDRLALADLNAIGPMCDRLLASNRFAEASAYEEIGMPEKVDELIQEMIKGAKEKVEEGDAKELEEGEVDFRAVYEIFKKMTPPQQKNLSAEIQKRAREQFLQVRQRFAGPESGWVNLPEPPEGPTKIASMNDVIDSLATLFMPVAHRQAAIAACRTRTQIRLLRLHAKVLAFRWENKRLPAALAELKLAKQVLFDPLSNQDLVYEADGTAYRLYSKGIKEIGEIDLRYRRPQSPDENLP